MAISLETASKVLTVVSLGIAVLAAWKALPLDAELKELQAQTQRLDLDLRATESKLKETETRLKETESSRKLSFDLYQEVKKVLERKENQPRDEEVLRVLIESLAEDPFRYKLLSVLAVGATTPEAKRSATESSEFFREEVQLSTNQQSAATPATSKPVVKDEGVGNYDIDVFYCAGKRTTSEPLAREVVGLKGPGESGRWRLRALPESVNQQPGYGVSANEIRFNAPEELTVAKKLQQRLANTGVTATLRETQSPTKWYVSIFVCQ